MQTALRLRTLRRNVELAGNVTPLRAAQRFVAKHEAAAQRLVRNHPLTAEQKLVGEVAGRTMKQRCRDSKDRWSPQPTPELFGEFAVGDGNRRLSPCFG
jgi:hypothetical protein